MLPQRIGIHRVLATAIVLAAAATSMLAPARAETRPQADPATVITFLVGLPFRVGALDAFATAASTPGSARFRQFLTVDAAAERFGASDAAVRRLATVAKAHGLVARVDRTRLFARVSGSVAEWQDLVGTPISFRAATNGSAQDSQKPFNTYAFTTANDDYAGTPADLAAVTTWWIPTFSQYVPGLDIPGLPPPTTKASGSLLEYPASPAQPLPTNQGTPMGRTCLPAADAAKVYTPDQVSQAYGLRALQSRVGVSIEPRVAILSLGGGFAASDLAAGAACFGYKAPRIDTRTGLGVPSPFVSLSGETALDLQTVSWALRNASVVREIQVTNTDTAYIEGYSVALTAWATPPDVITLSWGDCELYPRAGAGARVATEGLLRLAAAVGTAAFVAAADRGSSVCQSAQFAPADPRPTVSYPASSPFATAVGGTQLNLGAGNARVGESVWNDLQYGLTGNAVGTGGPSAVFNAPWYQRPRTPSDVRTVPDIAAQAGVGPAVAMYLGGRLQPNGGTSQASPLVAAGFAMISALLRAEGKPPLGFVNPWLYRAGHQHRGAFYDVTVGNNQYPVEYVKGAINVPACCQAQPGFDLASGLGAPLFDRLAAVRAG
ncbi:MAG: S53 family peptidase [Candidatus Nanopelagicales bacterium]